MTRALVAALIFGGSDLSDTTQLRWSFGDEEQVDLALRRGPGPIDVVLDMFDDDGSAALLWLHHQVERPEAKVLIIEDDPAVLSFCTEVIERMGLEVFAADSAGAAASHLEEHTIALALIDVDLPDASGFEISRELAMSAKQHGCVVLLMSADADLEADHTSVIEAGASGFIHHPVSATDLGDRVAETLCGAVDEANRVPASAVAQDSQIQVRFFGRPRVQVQGVETTFPSRAISRAACDHRVRVPSIGDFGATGPLRLGGKRRERVPTLSIRR